MTPDQKPNAVHALEQWELTEADHLSDGLGRLISSAAELNSGAPGVPIRFARRRARMVLPQTARTLDRRLDSTGEISVRVTCSEVGGALVVELGPGFESGWVLGLSGTCRGESFTLIAEVEDSRASIGLADAPRTVEFTGLYLIPIGSREEDSETTVRGVFPIDYRKERLFTREVTIRSVDRRPWPVPMSPESPMERDEDE